MTLVVRFSECSMMEQEDALNPTHRGSKSAVVSVPRVDFDRWRASGRTTFGDALSIPGNQKTTFAIKDRKIED